MPPNNGNYRIRYLVLKDEYDKLVEQTKENFILQSMKDMQKVNDKLSENLQKSLQLNDKIKMIYRQLSYLIDEHSERNGDEITVNYYMLNIIKEMLGLMGELNDLQ